MVSGAGEEMAMAELRHDEHIEAGPQETDAAVRADASERLARELYAARTAPSLKHATCVAVIEAGVDCLTMGMFRRACDALEEAVALAHVYPHDPYEPPEDSAPAPLIGSSPAYGAELIDLAREFSGASDVRDPADAVRTLDPLLHGDLTAYDVLLLYGEKPTARALRERVFDSMDRAIRGALADAARTTGECAVEHVVIYGPLASWSPFIAAVATCFPAAGVGVRHLTWETPAPSDATDARENGLRALSDLVGGLSEARFPDEPLPATEGIVCAGDRFRAQVADTIAELWEGFAREAAVYWQTGSLPQDGMLARALEEYMGVDPLIDFGPLGGDTWFLTTDKLCEELFELGMEKGNGLLPWLKLTAEMFRTALIEGLEAHGMPKEAPALLANHLPDTEMLMQTLWPAVLELFVHRWLREEGAPSYGDDRPRRIIWRAISELAYHGGLRPYKRFPSAKDFRTWGAPDCLQSILTWHTFRDIGAELSEEVLAAMRREHGNECAWWREASPAKRASREAEHATLIWEAGRPYGVSFGCASLALYPERLARHLLLCALRRAVREVDPWTTAAAGVLQRIDALEEMMGEEL